MKKIYLLALIPILAAVAFLTWESRPAKRFAKHITKARLYVNEKNFTAARNEYESAYKAKGGYTPYASMEVLQLTNRLNVMDKKVPEAFKNTRMYVNGNPKDAEARLILSQLAFQLEDIQTTFDALDTLLQFDPGNLNARLLLANIRARQGRLDLAEEQLRYLSDKYPDSVQAILPLAEILAQRGHPAECRKFLNHVLTLQPKNATAQLILVDGYLKERKPDSALAFLDHWKRTDTTHQLQIQLRKGEIYAQSKQFEAAIAATSAFQEAKEANAPAFAQRAVFYACSGKYDSAIDLYKKLEVLAPAAKVRIKTMLYYLYMKTNNPVLALESVKTAQIASPGPALLAPIVAAYMSMGKDKEAMDAIKNQRDSVKKAVTNFKNQLIPDRDFIGQWALIAYFGLNDQDAMTYDAVKAFYTRWPKVPVAILLWAGQLSSVGNAAEGAKVMATLPKPNVTQQIALMQLLYKSKQVEKAVKLADKLADENPKLPGLNAFMADYWMKSDKAKAMTLYEKELTINPDNRIVLNNLAWEYGAKQNDLLKAAPYLDKLKAMKNLDPQLLDTVGWILALNGKYPEGEKNIRKALASVPDYPSFLYHLGYIMNKTGNKQDARKYLEESLASKIPFEERKDAEKLRGEMG